MSGAAAKPCSTLGDAVRRAVQDVMAEASLSELSDVENLGRELEKRSAHAGGPITASVRLSFWRPLGMR